MMRQPESQLDPSSRQANLPALAQRERDRPYSPAVDKMVPNYQNSLKTENLGR